MKQHSVNLPPDLQQTLKSLDTDGSGTIDYTEFIAATITTHQYLKREVLWSAFRAFDKDGDGQITREELRLMLGSTDNEVEAQVAQMMKECDLDGSGGISWEEFIKMMEKEATKEVAKAKGP